MKIVILLLGLCIALAAGEGCSSTADCDWEHCDQDWVLGCHAGTCTCDPANGAGSCSHSSDCHNCQHGHRGFCLLGQCRCGFGDILGGNGK
nr:serine protease inhibitor [Meretrix meretrix]